MRPTLEIVTTFFQHTSAETGPMAQRLPKRAREGQRGPEVAGDGLKESHRGPQIAIESKRGPERE